MLSVITSFGRTGLHDWFLQRVTAFFIFFYCVFFIILYKFYFIDYNSWKSIFSFLWVKIPTVFFILSLIIHCWIGFWIILTDYIKITYLRLFIQMFLNFLLISFFFLSIEILWGI